MADQTAIDWLLDSDPAVAWQVQRDLLGLPESVWALTRARVETEGWGAELLSRQDLDGQWAQGAFLPAGFDRELWETEGQPWTATHHALTQLREFGLDPGSQKARWTVTLVGRNCRWDDAGQPFWAGETEPCINGQTVATGAWFGVDVSQIVVRLLAGRLPDGGWNCEAPQNSSVSSFDTTINVLEGLLAWQLTAGGTDAVRTARVEAEECLLRRSLAKRRSTGKVADDNYLRLGHPFRWHYNVLRGLDHFRRAAQADGSPPDPRLAEAVDWLRAKQTTDGTWPLELRHRGRAWFELGRVGEPSVWVTLYGLRILNWWDAQDRSDRRVEPGGSD